VWIIALSGMYFGQQWNVEANEPYLQLVSAAIIICIAFWMIWRTWQTQHAHHAHHPHAHSHDDNMKQIEYWSWGYSNKYFRGKYATSLSPIERRPRHILDRQ
jgi:ABC-type nickel/cobalt efflux system permease component RcnA